MMKTLSEWERARAVVAFERGVEMATAAQEEGDVYSQWALPTQKYSGIVPRWRAEVTEWQAVQEGHSVTMEMRGRFITFGYSRREVFIFSALSYQEVDVKLVLLPVREVRAMDVGTEVRGACNFAEDHELQNKAIIKDQAYQKRTLVGTLMYREVFNTELDLLGQTGEGFYKRRVVLG